MTGSNGWLIGVGINLVGSVMINAGTNLMKFGHNKREALEEPRPPISRIRAWQIGVAMFAVGNIGNFVSFGFAAQSLLAAIGCVQFVSNVIFAGMVLKEKVTPSVLAATALIVLGCILLVVFGSHSSAVYTAADLLSFYGRPPYIAYMSVAGATVLVTYALYWRGRRTIINYGVEAAGLWVTVLPVLYAVFSALIGTQSVLFSKALSTLIRATASGDNQFGKWFTWVIIIPAFLASAMFWVTRLNKGLNMFPAMVIVPTMQIAWTLFSILSGMLYYQEYAGFTALTGSMFCVGVGVVFAGVALLTRSSAAGKASTDRDLAEADKAKIAYQAYQEELEGEEGEGAGLKIAAGRESDPDTTGAEAADGPQVPATGRSSPDLGDSTRAAAALPGGDDAAGEAAAGDAAGGKPAGEAGSPKAGARPRSSLEASRPGRAAGGQPQGQDPGPLLEGRNFVEVVSNLGKRVRGDFNLDQETAMKLTLGLGGRQRPAMSIFGVPTLDMGRGGQGLALAEAARRRTAELAAQQAAPASGSAAAAAPAAASSAASINPLSNAIDVHTGRPGKPPVHPGAFVSGVAAKVERGMEKAAAKLKQQMERVADAADSGLLAGGGHRGYARMGGKRTADDERQMRPMLGREDSGLDDEL